MMRVLRGFCRFWWDFVVGDDWRIALGILTVLALGALAVSAGGAGDAAVTVLGALAIIAVALASILRAAPRADRDR